MSSRREKMYVCRSYKDQDKKRDYSTYDTDSEDSSTECNNQQMRSSVSTVDSVTSSKRKCAVSRSSATSKRNLFLYPPAPQLQPAAASQIDNMYFLPPANAFFRLCDGTNTYNENRRWHQNESPSSTQSHSEWPSNSNRTASRQDKYAQCKKQPTYMSKGLRSSEVREARIKKASMHYETSALRGKKSTNTLQYTCLKSEKRDRSNPDNFYENKYRQTATLANDHSQVIKGDRLKKVTHYDWSSGKSDSRTRGHSGIRSSKCYMDRLPSIERNRRRKKSPHISKSSAHSDRNQSIEKHGHEHSRTRDSHTSHRKHHNAVPSASLSRVPRGHDYSDLVDKSLISTPHLLSERRHHHYSERKISSPDNTVSPQFCRRDDQYKKSNGKSEEDRRREERLGGLVSSACKGLRRSGSSFSLSSKNSAISEDQLKFMRRTKAQRINTSEIIAAAAAAITDRGSDVDSFWKGAEAVLEYIKSGRIGENISRNDSDHESTISRRQASCDQQPSTSSKLKHDLMAFCPSNSIVKTQSQDASLLSTWQSQLEEGECADEDRSACASPHDDMSESGRLTSMNECVAPIVLNLKRLVNKSKTASYCEIVENHDLEEKNKSKGCQLRAGSLQSKHSTLSRKSRDRSPEHGKKSVIRKKQSKLRNHLRSQAVDLVRNMTSKLREGSVGLRDRRATKLYREISRRYRCLTPGLASLRTSAARVAAGLRRDEDKEKVERRSSSERALWRRQQDARAREDERRRRFDEECKRRRRREEENRVAKILEDRYHLPPSNRTKSGSTRRGSIRRDEFHRRVTRSARSPPPSRKRFCSRSRSPDGRRKCKRSGSLEEAMAAEEEAATCASVMQTESVITQVEPVHRLPTELEEIGQRLERCAVEREHAFQELVDLVEACADGGNGAARVKARRTRWGAEQRPAFVHDRDVIVRCDVCLCELDSVDDIACHFQSAEHQLAASRDCDDANGVRRKSSITGECVPCALMLHNPISLRQHLLTEKHQNAAFLRRLARRQAELGPLLFPQTDEELIAEDNDVGEEEEEESATTSSATEAALFDPLKEQVPPVDIAFLSAEAAANLRALEAQVAQQRAAEAVARMIRPEDTADKIQMLVMNKYLEVCKTLNPALARWRVLAGFVLTQPGVPPRVVCIATGTKCISGNELNQEGLSVNDCHAEVLARRCLQRFLYQQLELHTDPVAAQASIFERVSSGLDGTTPFSLRPGVGFHLYIHSAPCGDSRLFIIRDFAAQAVDHDNCPMHRSRGLLRVKVENALGGLPARPHISDQTWETLGRGSRLKTMCCSDKVLQWNVCGLQGALLANLIRPIYLQNLVLGSVYNREHLYRAVFERAEDIRLFPTKYSLPEHYILSKPNLACTRTKVMPIGAGRAPNLSVTWVAGESQPELMVSTSGRLYMERTSRLCKWEMFSRYLQLWPELGLPSRDYIKMSYCEVKNESSDYQKSKQVLRQLFANKLLGKWMGKPFEVDDFCVAMNSAQEEFNVSGKSEEKMRVERLADDAAIGLSKFADINEDVKELMKEIIDTVEAQVVEGRQ